MAALLGGCSINPANWFHQREGGVVAQPHQPVPGENEPYPNLASIPPAPTPPNKAELESIYNGLIADRAHAQYLAENAPLPDPSSPQASPGLFGIGTAPPPPPAGAAVASLPAANAAPAAAPAPQPVPPAAAAPVPAVPQPPATAKAPAKAPVAAVQTTPLPAAIPPAPAPSPSPPAPTIGTAPPPPPPIAPAQTAALPPATSPGEAPSNPADMVEVAFPPGSATITQPDALSLKALAARRGNKLMEALGRGDAASAAPSAQQTAITLGFARAQAIAKALQAAGVPDNSIQVMSLAGGRGGAAKLIE